MIEFDSTSTRRLPVYLVLDVSASMSGDGIEALNQGVQLALTELKNDPMALETAWISCITFADDVDEILPLTEVGRASIPAQSAGGVTRLAKPLRLLLDKLENEVRPNTPQQKGDYKPLIFIMSDGNPTDREEWPTAAAELREHAAQRTANIIALGCGQAIQTDILKRITPTVLLMEDATPDNIRAFFKWVSQSVRVSSRRASDKPASDDGTVDLPPLPSAIQIVLD